MKILFAIDTYDTNNNGTSISAQRYAAELRRRGHEVRILASDKSDKVYYQLPIFKVPYFQKYCIKHGFFFAAIDKNVIDEALEWADILHCYVAFAMERYASIEAMKRGIPCTSAFHIQPENMWSSVGLGNVTWIQEAYYRHMLKLFYKRFRHIHTPSAFMARMLQDREYHARIHAISNGIQHEFMDAGAAKMAQRAEQGNPVPNYKKCDTIKIMMIGRLSQEKRQDVIINAIPFSKYADKIQLVFAGRGPEYDKYVKLGKQLKFEPKFIFVNRDELIQELLETDLYIHASDMESEAISCIEAFATGLVPIIANSKLSATPQFAIDGRSLFAPGNYHGLARAIDYWLDHPKEKQKMEEEYRKQATRYSLENSVTQFEEMLEEEIAENQLQLNK